jgi:hypothetical protein
VPVNPTKVRNSFSPVTRKDQDFKPDVANDDDKLGQREAVC